MFGFRVRDVAFILAICVAFGFTPNGASAAPLSAPLMKSAGATADGVRDNNRSGVIRVDQKGFGGGGGFGRGGGGFGGGKGGFGGGGGKGGFSGGPRMGPAIKARPMARQNFGGRNFAPKARAKARARFNAGNFRPRKRAAVRRKVRRNVQRFSNGPGVRNFYKKRRRVAPNVYKKRRVVRKHIRNRKYAGHNYPRARHRNNRFRYFYRNWYYAYPWWLYGGYYVASNYYGDAHVEWCLDHHRNYNPRTNLFIGYDGIQRECVSPYYDPYY